MRKSDHLLLGAIIGAPFLFLGYYSYNYQAEKSLVCKGDISASNTLMRRGESFDFSGYIKINLPNKNIDIQLSDQEKDVYLLRSTQVEVLHNWQGKLSGVKVVSVTKGNERTAESFARDYNILMPNTVYDFSVKKIHSGVYLTQIGLSAVFCQEM